MLDASRGGLRRPRGRSPRDGCGAHWMSGPQGGAGNGDARDAAAEARTGRDPPAHGCAAGRPAPRIRTSRARSHTPASTGACANAQHRNHRALRSPARRSPVVSTPRRDPCRCSRPKCCGCIRRDIFHGRCAENTRSAHVRRATDMRVDAMPHPRRNASRPPMRRALRPSRRPASMPRRLHRSIVRRDAVSAIATKNPACAGFFRESDTAAPVACLNHPAGSRWCDGW